MIAVIFKSDSESFSFLFRSKIYSVCKIICRVFLSYPFAVFLWKLFKVRFAGIFNVFIFLVLSCFKTWEAPIKDIIKCTLSFCNCVLTLMFSEEFTWEHCDEDITICFCQLFADVFYYIFGKCLGDVDSGFQGRVLYL